MRFTWLKIRNFRGIAEAQVGFAPTGITLIQGPNEIGKSSLGEAIHILFDYPDSSKHRDIEAILPVGRDVGPEVELQAESGPYAFTYFKRFRKKPETRLAVSRPKAENRTGREAHDRALAILGETLDISLWKALSIQQGEAVTQPGLTGQTSLSAALDRAAGGHTTDPRGEDLFGRVHEEYRRYYTEGGAEAKSTVDSRRAQEGAQAEVEEVERKLISLEKDIERAAVLRREIRRFAVREAELAKEIEVQDALLEEIRSLESACEAALLKLELARKTETSARKDSQARQSLIDAVARATRARQDVATYSGDSLSALNRAEDDLKAALESAKEAEQRRKNAYSLASLRRADFDYYSRKLNLEQLRERKDRIDQARKSAARAEELLAGNKVDAGMLQRIQDAERALLTANAQLQMEAPGVTLRALKNMVLAVDGSEVKLEKGEVRTHPVPDRSTLSIPGTLDIEITAGSGGGGLARKADDAQRALDEICRAAGVADAEEARRSFEERREAARQVEGKTQVEKENLRDLAYDDLQQRLLGLEMSVPEYIAGRAPEPVICLDRDSAQREWNAAETALRQATSEWEKARGRHDAARDVRDSRDKKHQEFRLQLGQAERESVLAQESLDRARRAIADDALRVALDEAVRIVRVEEANAAAAEASLAARNPDRVKTLAETAKGSRSTTARQLRLAEDELIEVQARLKDHGEEGLHERLQAVQVRLERLDAENRGLFARAAAAKRLFDVMRDERDRARLAYVAPLKARIEGLGRLVFDETFEVNVTDELQIESRTLNGIPVRYEWLSGGTREQLSLIFRLTCSMIVGKDGGVPIILDDALGYTDPERLRLMGAVLARAAKECQIIIFTCVPDRYGNIGEARVVPLK